MAKMHILQQHILRELVFNEKSRYTDLKPKGIESNRFAYHLNALEKDGYIKQAEGKYKLTALGNRYVDKLSLKNFQPRLQPKIVTLTIVKNKEGKYLFYVRKRQPFLGYVSFPYGKTHFGESIKEAAKREVKEKSALVVSSLKYRGDAYLTVHKDKELLTYMLCHVFEGNQTSGELKESEESRPFWGILQEVKGDFVPGFFEIFEIARKEKDTFFREIRIDI